MDAERRRFLIACLHARYPVDAAYYLDAELKAAYCAIDLPSFEVWRERMTPPAPPDLRAAQLAANEAELKRIGAA
jgi:hypothetical protein